MTDSITTRLANYNQILINELPHYIAFHTGPICTGGAWLTGWPAFDCAILSFVVTVVCLTIVM